MQDRLGELFPYLEHQKIQGVEVAFGPDGPQAQTGTETSYVFSGDDGHSIVLTPDSATLTAGSQYRDVDYFAELLGVAIAAITETFQIRRFDRLGVRYLNLAAIPPGDARAWSRWFRPELVGWIGIDGVLAETTRLASALNQVNVVSEASEALAGLPGPAQAFIRHGFVPGGSVAPGIPPISVVSDSYLIDCDVFVVAQHDPSPSTIIGEFRTLHGHVDRFFHWALTAEGATHFGQRKRQ